MKNILLLSAGRRVELVQHFKSAATAQGRGTRIVAADAQVKAPALFFADDRVIIQRVNDKSYLPRLIEVIREHEVGLVIPTIDTELPFLAHFRRRIQEQTGAKVLVASEEVIKICSDKVLTAQFFEQNGFGFPQLYPEPSALDDDVFPVFLKPKAGSSGIGATPVFNRDELSHLMSSTQDPMVQELAQGDEYTVDCFSDYTGEPISIVPRVRLAVRGGEILQGTIVRNSTISDEVRRMLQLLRIPGPSTVQCFLHGDSVKFIEVNPRFGGGAPMSIAAGANSCAHLLTLLHGGEVAMDDSFESGLTFLRFDQSVCIGADGEPIEL